MGRGLGERDREREEHREGHGAEHAALDAFEGEEGHVDQGDDGLAEGRGAAHLLGGREDLGVALVELGAAVTTVSLYAGGMLVEMASLPFGARKDEFPGQLD